MLVEIQAYVCLLLVPVGMARAGCGSGWILSESDLREKNEMNDFACEEF